jgi:hypothetical protein
VLAAITPARAQDAAFTLPADARPARRSLGSVVDCASHGAWTPPEGWSVGRVETGDVVAVAPEGRAILIRVQTRTRRTHVRSTDDFLRIANIVTGRWATDVALLEVVEQARSRWHFTRRTEGTANVRGTAMRALAESRGERQLWVALWDAAAPELAAVIETAMASYLPLVDHACVCGYDCDTRARAAP